MLTPEQNARITQVGPGTPGGNLLRRYWHPVAAAGELSAEHPRKRVRILGEDLVLYRTESGGFGLLAEHCSHRGTSLYYGFVEGECLRCPYHGWLYDSAGKCLEQPFEPAQSLMKHTLRHGAYPVQELAGLLFAYLGPPEKQPLLPRWDILTWTHGTRKIQMRPVLNCNWLQAEENTADFVHTFFLHGWTTRKQKPDDDVNFFIRPFARYGFQPTRWGIVKTWEYEGATAGSGYGNLVLFPTMLRQTDVMSTIHWRVPIDDEHTTIFQVSFSPTSDGSDAPRGETPWEYEASWQGEDGDYHLKTFSSQDGMAWETQGAVFDRSKEHLGYSDRGVSMLREMLLREIDVVEEGGDPMALVFEEAENRSINLEGWASARNPEFGARSIDIRGVERIPKDQIFDDRFELFEVPFGTARPKAEVNPRSS
jgi:5,5'-dehydrodivanillate O-demethylase oxygenase subunit